MPKLTCAILATFTSSEHGLTSACRVWSATSPRPLWTRRTARHVPIPTLHGAISRLRSTWCKPNLQQTLDAIEGEKDDTLANIPKCFDCRILTDSGVSHGIGRSVELPSRDQKRCHCSRCVGRWIKLVQSDPTAPSQGIACGRCTEPIDLAGRRRCRHQARHRIAGWTCIAGGPFLWGSGDH